MRKILNKRSIALILLFWAICIQSYGVEIDIKPGLQVVRALYTDHVNSWYRVSPDGAAISWIEQEGEIQRLHIRDLMRDRESVLSSRRDTRFIDYTWVDAEMIAVVEADFQTVPQAVRVFFYDKAVKRYANVYNQTEVKGAGTRPDVLPTIMAGLPAIPGKILLGVRSDLSVDPRRRAKGARPLEIILFDVNEGSSKLILSDDGGVDNWVVDSRGEVRFAIENFGDRRIRYRENNESPWEDISLADMGAQNIEASIMGFLPGDRLLLIGSWGEDDRSKLVVFDCEKRKITNVLVDDPTFDVSEWRSNGYPRRDPATGNVIGVRYDGHTPVALWLKRDWQSVQTTLNERMPGLINHLVGFVNGGQTAVVQVVADVEPGRLLLVQTDNWKPEMLVDSQPSARRLSFQRTQPIAFQARDGYILSGYLTLPADFKKGKKVPLINIVHGGPMARDSWGLEDLSAREAQIFAAMGFAVIQVNYRGSTGYGLAHQGSTQYWAARFGVEDVADGTRWAIGAGFVEPSRTVIYGASFGGYSALSSAVNEPDLYALVIGAMGVYDWRRMIEWDKTQSHPLVWESLKSRYGPEDEIDEHYDRWTPAKHADKIRSPVLILHGKEDARVDEEQARVMVSALKSAGVDYEDFRYTIGGHGFGDAKGWFAYYQRIATFIDKRWNH